MKCVDCHRNGLGHNITRGYEGEEQILDPSRAALTCQGCHIEGESSAGPLAGRLGAPVAKHPGIPTVHFDRLSCTACHSGPWPGRKTYRVKTSRAHALGTHNVNKSDEALPHIITPVFAEESGYSSACIVQESGCKIGPHNLIWPAFWGSMEEGNVRPVAIDIVKPIAGKIIGGENLPATGDWPSVSEEQIAEVLALLSSEGTVEGTPVYICGGKLYSLDDNDPNQLSQTEHSAAQAYLW
ncbi:MAG: cytochrome c3 family protein, partial [Planctomycetota bacterium]